MFKVPTAMPTTNKFAPKAAHLAGNMRNPSLALRGIAPGGIRAVTGAPGGNATPAKRYIGANERPNVMMPKVQMAKLG